MKLTDGDYQSTSQNDKGCESRTDRINDMRNAEGGYGQLDNRDDDLIDTDRMPGSKEVLFKGPNSNIL